MQSTPTYFPEVAPVSDKVMADYADLLTLTKKDDPALRAAITGSRDEAQAGFESMLEIKNAIARNKEDIRGRVPIWMQLNGHLNKLAQNDVYKLGVAQTAIARQNMDQQTSFCKTQLQTTWVLACVDLVCSVLSALYVTRSITMRIAKINDNAYRLASGVPLNSVMPGRDAISDLDSNFHKMAQALREAEAQKQEVVLMVTHDLRTPLTTLKNIHRFLRSGNFGQFDTKGSEYIMVANRNVERMSNLVNDLLDIEKVKSGLMTLDKQSCCSNLQVRDVRPVSQETLS